MPIVDGKWISCIICDPGQRSKITDKCTCLHRCSNLNCQTIDIVNGPNSVAEQVKRMKTCAGWEYARSWTPTQKQHIRDWLSLFRDDPPAEYAKIYDRIKNPHKYG